MGKQLDSQLRGYASNPKAMAKDPTFPIFEEGMKRGKVATQHMILTHLENKYVSDEDRPDRNSPRGQALLQLARELSIWLRQLDVTEELKGA